MQKVELNPAFYRSKGDLPFDTAWLHAARGFGTYVHSLLKTS